MYFNREPTRRKIRPEGRLFGRPHLFHRLTYFGNPNLSGLILRFFADCTGSTRQDEARSSGKFLDGRHASSSCRITITVKAILDAVLFKKASSLSKRYFLRHLVTSDAACFLSKTPLNIYHGKLFPNIELT
jgi:hypothetical protein